jgi:hypothetical protein
MTPASKPMPNRSRAHATSLRWRVLGFVALALFILAPGALAATPAKAATATAATPVRRHAHHRHHATDHGSLRAVPAGMAQGDLPAAPRRAPAHAHRRAILLPGPQGSAHRAATRPLPRAGGAFREAAAARVAIGWTRLGTPPGVYVIGVTLADKMERGPPLALPCLEPSPHRYDPARSLDLTQSFPIPTDSDRPCGRSRAAPLKGTAARLRTPFAGDEA